MRYLVLFALFFSSLNGEIIEFNSFKDLPSYLTPNTLVILDIDDTLLIPRQMLGCDEWFVHRLTKRKLEGISHPEALEKTLAEWEAVRHLTQMDIVEPETELIIRSLQAQGYCVFGLTTQGLSLATRTIQQLKENAIDLSLTAPTQEDIYFSLNHHGVLFRKGVLYTSGRPKGKALLELCKAIDRPIHRIVFVNDKATHLSDMETTVKEHAIEFLGLRYAYSDARKAAFIPEVAEVQFSHSSFANILSDEDAKNILQK